MEDIELNSQINNIINSQDFINNSSPFGFATNVFIVCFLGACASPTAMLGPAYTLTSSGNVFQAGLSYGSNELITMYTGKTPIENVKEITLNQEKNIQKQTLESEDFYVLVKNKINKTQAILKKTNQ